MACSDILWTQACRVRLIAFTTTWTERAVLPLSIRANLCSFMIYTRRRKKNMYKLPDFPCSWLIGEPGGWTPGGRHAGDHPRHQPRFGLLRHGGQRGGGGCEVYTRGGWLHHCGAVSHKQVVIFIQQLKRTLHRSCLLFLVFFYIMHGTFLK